MNRSSASSRSARFPAAREAIRNLLRYGELDVREFYILHDRRVVFLVISKVACTSIKVAIAAAYGLRVEDPLAIHDVALWRRGIPSFEYALGQCPVGCRDYFKFAFVRNPFERLVSCYEDKVACSEGGSPPAGRPFPGYPLVPAGVSFDRFAQIVSRIPDRLADRHFRGQASSLYRRGRSLVDFVGRFESLEDGWGQVAKRCDFPARLPRANETFSRGRDYRTYYSEPTAALVRHRFRRDFDAFGYDRIAPEPGND